MQGVAVRGNRLTERKGQNMNNKTLKDFFHGNLTPADKQTVRGSEAARAAAELSDAEDRLAQALPTELQPLLDRFTKAQGRVDVITAEESYIDGFKTGARFMMEILDDTRENLKPITE